MADDKAIYEEHWPDLRIRLEEGGGAAAVDYIDGQSPEVRAALYRRARAGVAMGEWNGKHLDAVITVADAGIAAALQRRESAGDGAGRIAALEDANIISFNLAADLADCWPGDDMARAHHHFERGERAGEDCVRWRRELDKPASSLQLGWWALGIHQLHLGKNAIDAMDQSWTAAVRAAEESGEPTSIGPDAGFTVVLSAGYSGLARMARGDPDGNEVYNAALAAFREQLNDTDRSADASFGIDQLEKVRKGYVVTPSSG